MCVRACVRVQVTSLTAEILTCCMSIIEYDCAVSITCRKEMMALASWNLAGQESLRTFQVHKHLWLSLSTIICLGRP